MTQSISNAVETLRKGGVVAFPTETVYGLGADASNPLAVRQIFAHKGRPADHPLIVHLRDADQIDKWAYNNVRASALAAQFWPGPLTLILPKRSHVPDEVTAGLQTIGLRVPRHPVAAELLDKFGGALAAPSANLFGAISPTSAAHVREEFGDEILIIDGGQCAIGVESTIIDLCHTQPGLVRPGGVPVEEIESIVGACGPSATRAPGTLPSHYAPKTSLLVTNTPSADANRLRAQGRTVAVLTANETTEYAHRLYAELRRLDGLGVDILVAEMAPNAGLGLAINDRLRRASAVRPNKP